MPYRTIKVPDAEYGSLLNRQGVTTIVTGWGLQEGARPSPELRQAQIQILDRILRNAALLEARADEAVGGFAFAAQTPGVREDDACAVWDELLARAPEPMSENLICSGTSKAARPVATAIPAARWSFRWRMGATTRPGSSRGG